MELILYYLLECKDLLISFLILMFGIALICFFIMRNFSQEKKGKIIFYGLFFNMNNIDVLKMSSVLIRVFLVVYACIAYEQEKILISIIMIILSTLFYILFTPKRIIYETFSTLINIATIYLIYTINSYAQDVENTLVILFIRMFFIIFVLMFNTYLFFREIDAITKDREEKVIKSKNKEEKANANK